MTVCRPMWGCGATSRPCRLVDGGGPHVVEEAPGSDGSATSARERPPYAKGADPALAALGDLDTRGERMVGGVGDGGSVGGGDRSAHDALGSSRHTAARYPPPTAWMSRTAGVPPVGRIVSVALVVSRPGRSEYGGRASTSSLMCSGKYS